MEYDGSSGQLLQRYVYGRGGQGLSLVDGAGNRSTPVPDIQGSRIALIDGQSGSVTKTGYLPFGESADATGAFRYTGQRIDAETNGLYYYRARMYSPALGRFLQPDPAGYAGGRNLYAYVGNDPLNFVDPTGLAAVSDADLGNLRGGGDAGIMAAGGSAPAGFCVVAEPCGASVSVLGAVAAPLLFSAWLFSPAHPEAMDTFVRAEGGDGAATGGGSTGAADGSSGSLGDSSGASGGSSGTSGGDSASAPTASDAAPSRTYIDTTNPGAKVPNVTTDATAQEAGQTLQDNGFTATQTSDGRATVYTNPEGDSYTIRPSNSASGGKAADFTPAGSTTPDLKINFGGP